MAGEMETGLACAIRSTYPAVERSDGQTIAPSYWVRAQRRRCFSTARPYPLEKSPTCHSHSGKAKELGMSKEYKKPKAKVISPDTKKVKYRVIITENREVLLDCPEGDTIAGESFLADSLEEAERILYEHTAVPGKGGLIYVPGSDEPSSIVPPMRTRDDVAAAETEFYDKVWYDRHQKLKDRTKSGKEKLSTVFHQADFAARRMEAEYGKGNLGPYTDFEWGMINGKLSALRWVLGDECDMLDT
jgi:hypothetical protein